METTGTRDKIWKGASGLFLRYGIRSVSHGQHCQPPGDVQKTIYQYFRDKDEIVYSVTEAPCAEERQQFGEIANKSKMPLRSW